MRGVREKDPPLDGLREVEEPLDRLRTPRVAVTRLAVLPMLVLRLTVLAALERGAYGPANAGSATRLATPTMAKVNPNNFVFCLMVCALPRSIAAACLRTCIHATDSGVIGSMQTAASDSIG